ncbi:MAG: SdrD B-like domain-containing protein [Candidatus Paceibacterota bacterium]
MGVDGGDSISAYPIIEFTTAGESSYVGWRVYDDLNGAWIYLGSVPFSYDTWHTLELRYDYDDTLFDIYVDGTEVSSNVAAGSVDLSHIILNSYNYDTGSAPDDYAAHWSAFMYGEMPVPCTPQHGVPGPTDIENSATGDYFDTVDDALADCDTSDGDTISLLGDITISEQITLDRPIIFDGGGFTIDAAYTKTGNDNNSAIGVQSDDVTVQNVILDGTNGTDLHGVNVYVSEDVTVTDVHAMNFRSGMVVNGSTVDAENFTTAGNIWHGINVAPGGGVTTPSILNVSATSEHDEERLVIPHIFTDDVTAGTIEVNDLDDQYEVFEFGDARAYWLKRVASLEITSPATDGEVFPPMEMTFEALFTDDDDTEDTINWAIKPGSCEANNPTVNLLGYGTPGYTPAAYNPLTGEIEVTADLSGFDDGDYCFVVNPEETGDGTDQDREVRLFTLETPSPICHLPYVVEFDDESDDDTFSTTPGDTGLVIEEVDGGYTIGLYDDGRDGVYRVKGTITFPDGTNTASFAFSEASGNDGLEQTHGTYPDVADRSGTTIEFDLFVNGADDIFTILDDTLENEANCDVIFPPLPDPSLTITDPGTDDETLTGSHTFLGEYVDADDVEDAMRWAIRAGTCAASTGTVAGNVDGYSDPFSWDGADFSTTVDMSTWADGEYCLVLNPDESGDGEDFRATRTFFLDNPEPPVCEPGVNILENPSFEDPVVTAKKGWDILTPVAWVVEKVADNSPVGMELQRTVNGWSHSDGAQHTELAGNERNQTYQTVATVPGETYTLSWDYSPRPGKSFGENKMEVFIDGVEVDTNQESGIGLEDTDWTSHSYTFVADGETEVMFADAGDGNSFGPFLDNTALVCGDPEDPVYLIDGYKWDDENGNGYWDEWEYGLADWTIEATNGVTTLSTTTDEYGYYYFVVSGEEEEWTVSEVQQYGWEQTAPMPYLMLDTLVIDEPIIIDDPIAGVCTFVLGDDDDYVKPKLMFESEVEYDGYYHCEFGNYHVAETVDGYKWNDENGNGEWDEGEQTIAGWEIEITNGEDTFSTTTDMYGYYWFEVESGAWTVSEVQQNGWTQTYPTDPNTCTFDVVHMSDEYFKLYEEEYPYEEYSCDFGNQYEGTTNDDATLRCNLSADDTDVRENALVKISWEAMGDSFSINNDIGSVGASGSENVVVSSDTTFTLTVSNEEETIDCSVDITTSPGSGSGGSGGNSLSSTNSSGPEERVLGAATSVEDAPQCDMYLFDYMRMGINNDLLRS